MKDFDKVELVAKFAIGFAITVLGFFLLAMLFFTVTGCKEVPHEEVYEIDVVDNGQDPREEDPFKPIDVNPWEEVHFLLDYSYLYAPNFSAVGRLPIIPSGWQAPDCHCLESKYTPNPRPIHAYLDAYCHGCHYKQDADWTPAHADIRSIACHNCHPAGDSVGTPARIAATCHCGGSGGAPPGSDCPTSPTSVEQDCHCCTRRITPPDSPRGQSIFCECHHCPSLKSYCPPSSPRNSNSACHCCNKSVIPVPGPEPSLPSPNNKGHWHYQIQPARWVCLGGFVVWIPDDEFDREDHTVAPSAFATDIANAICPAAKGRPCELCHIGWNPLYENAVYSDQYVTNVCHAARHSCFGDKAPDVPWYAGIYVDEACYDDDVVTSRDLPPYLREYLDVCFDDEVITIKDLPPYQGINFRRCPAVGAVPCSECHNSYGAAYSGVAFEIGDYDFSLQPGDPGYRPPCHRPGYCPN